MRNEGLLVLAGCAALLIAIMVLTDPQRIAEAQSAATQQQAKQLVRVRNFVIPQTVIDSFEMRPVDEKTFGQWVVGEDDRVYGLDETLRVLFVMSREHWRANDLKRELAAPSRK